MARTGCGRRLAAMAFITNHIRSNVVAYLALFLALAGSSYAAVSITGKQVRDGSLSGRDVHNATLTTKDVRDQTLLASDFKQGQLPAGPQGPKGDQGLTGDPGPQGAKGDPAAAGVAGHEIVRVQSEETSESFRQVFAECPVGKVVVGGGAELVNLDGSFTLISSVVIDISVPANTKRWVADAHELNPTTEDWTLVAYAICATKS
jgi:hypothetical protein